jgi:mannose-6-phosphate isomerase-like protein (cupin superfamily)
MPNTVDDFEYGDKMSKSNLATLPPFAQGRRLDNSRWYMGNMMTFLVNSGQTNGAFSMTDYLSKPGNEPPAHMHDREDEFCYVLEGRIDAYVGNEVFPAGPNEGVYFPKFYRDVLGMQVVGGSSADDPIGASAFLSSRPEEESHEIAFFARQEFCRKRSGLRNEQSGHLHRA